MQIYTKNIADLTKMDGLKTAVALGGFDAMHLGHTEIIKKVVNYAKDNQIKSLVYMFSNNPAEVITGKNISAVNSLEKRIDILKNLGVDIVVSQKFDLTIMNMSCEDFADNFLKRLFGARFVVAGYNYSFGKDGSGDINILKRLCDERKIKLYAMPEITVDKKTVSSTVIRELVADGKVKSAAKLMGRYYSVCGTVVKGNGIGGSLLGFPTANIELPTDCVIPKFGVYISRTRVDEKAYDSITNIGGKPTVDKDKNLIETYIDGKFGELYGKFIEVELYEKIRDIIKFDGKAELMRQIEVDVKKMKDFFKED